MSKSKVLYSVFIVFFSFLVCSSMVSDILDSVLVFVFVVSICDHIVGIYICIMVLVLVSRFFYLLCCYVIIVI